MHTNLVDAVAAARVAVADVSDHAIELSLAIHADPELSFREHRAAERIADFLASQSFDVERGVGGLETAVRGIGPKRTDGPTVALLGEYDALPGLGHACGHNLMAMVGATAAVAAEAIRSPGADGRIVFVGTPAEEDGSGKQVMIDAGVFGDADVALLFHPADRTTLRPELLALSDVRVEFRGRSAHASLEPWAGVNAADAATLTQVAVGLWRQQLEPGARVHGIVVDGGAAPNIIPDAASLDYTVRHPTDAGLAILRERLESIVDGCARATGSSVSTSWSGHSAAMTRWTALEDLVDEALAAVGIVDDPRPRPAGSSDIGNLSQVMPCAQPMVAVCDAGAALHTSAFTEVARGERAHRVGLDVAAAFAGLAVWLLERPEQLRAVRRPSAVAV